MSEEDRTESEGRPKRRKKTTIEVSTQVKNYANALGVVLPAITGLVLGIIANAKGEPEAEKGYEAIQELVNKQTDHIQSLRIKFAHFEGKEEGANLAHLEQQIKDLQRENERLRTAREEGPPAPKKTCREGYVQVNNRCKRVPKAVADKVNEAESLQKKLDEERAKRLQTLQRKRELMKKLQQQKAAPAPPPLKRLPEKLDAVKRKSDVEG